MIRGSVCAYNTIEPSFFVYIAIVSLGEGYLVTRRRLRLLLLLLLSVISLLLPCRRLLLYGKFVDMLLLVLLQKSLLVLR